MITLCIEQRLSYENKLKLYHLKNPVRATWNRTHRVSVSVFFFWLLPHRYYFGVYYSTYNLIYLHPNKWVTCSHHRWGWCGWLCFYFKYHSFGHSGNGMEPIMQEALVRWITIESLSFARRSPQLHSIHLRLWAPLAHCLNGKSYGCILFSIFRSYMPISYVCVV